MFTSRPLRGHLPSLIRRDVVFKIVLNKDEAPVDFEWSMVPDDRKYVAVSYRGGVIACRYKPELRRGIDKDWSPVDGDNALVIGQYDKEEHTYFCRNYSEFLFERPHAPQDAGLFSFIPLPVEPDTSIESFTWDKVDDLYNFVAVDKDRSIYAFVNEPKYSPNHGYGQWVRARRDRRELSYIGLWSCPDGGTQCFNSKDMLFKRPSSEPVPSIKINLTEATESPVRDARDRTNHDIPAESTSLGSNELYRAKVWIRPDDLPVSNIGTSPHGKVDHLLTMTLSDSIRYLVDEFIESCPVDGLYSNSVITLRYSLMLRGLDSRTISKVAKAYDKSIEVALRLKRIELSLLE
jgi:hypothetical protein